MSCHGMGVSPAIGTKNEHGASDVGINRLAASRSNALLHRTVEPTAVANLRNLSPTASQLRPALHSLFLD